MIVGDVVRLKSGGPRMTVARITSRWHRYSRSSEGEHKQECSCVYFIGYVKCNEVFTADLLQLDDKS